MPMFSGAMAVVDGGALTTGTHEDGSVRAVVASTDVGESHAVMARALVRELEQAAAGVSGTSRGQSMLAWRFRTDT
jgi:uncharacterized protein (UPF0261 family)